MTWISVPSGGGSFTGGTLTSDLVMGSGTAIKPASGQSLVLEDEGGDAAVSISTLGVLTHSLSGTANVVLTTNQVQVGSGGAFTFDTTTAPNGFGSDLYLRRSAASTLTVDADGAGAAATLAVTNLTAIGTGSLTVAAGSGDDLFLNARGANKVRVGSSRVSFATQELALGSVSAPGVVTASDDAAGVTLAESSATTVSTVSCATDSVFSGLAHVITYATDGTEDQVRATLALVTIQNDGGTVSGTVTEVSSQLEETDGASTLTDTITVADGGSGLANVQVNAVSSLTQTTLNCRVHWLSASQSLGGTTSVGYP